VAGGGLGLAKRSSYRKNGRPGPSREPMSSSSPRRGRIVLVLAALLALALGLFLYFEGGPRPIDELPQGTGEIGGPRDPRNGTTLEGDTNGGSRGSVSGARPQDRTNGGTGGVALVGVIQDAQGQTIVRPPPDPAQAATRQPTFIAWARRSDTTKVLQGQVDGEGRYRIEGLGQGTWAVTASAYGHLVGRATIELTGAEREHVLDFKLEREPVVEAELSVRGAELLARDPAVADTLLDRIYGSCELFVSALPPARRAPFLPADQQPLSVGPFGVRKVVGPDWVFHQRVPLGQQVDAFASLIIAGEVIESLPTNNTGELQRFSIDAGEFLTRWGSLGARVVDARSGAPVADATVELHLLELQQGIDESTLLARATSDSQGAVELAALPIGDFELKVQAQGYTELVRKVSVAAGARVDAGVLALEMPLEIRGRVDGGPHGLMVEATLIQLAGSAVEPRTERAPVLTNGGFHFRELARGTYVLRLQRMGDWVTTPQVHDLANGSVAGVVLRASAGAPVSFELRTSRADPIDLDLVDEHGLAVATATASRPTALAPGRYTVTARTGATRLAQQTFEVGTQPTTVSITIP